MDRLNVPSIVVREVKSPFTLLERSSVETVIRYRITPRKLRCRDIVTTIPDRNLQRIRCDLALR